ncbi:PAS domain-containing protein [Sphingomonas sp. URHD0057]|uniref:PAS domain-containing protein n=1 Tax=Sphingomonas sp. URHD0057 TaxID=1380389 RepID=UPI00048D33F8|nr:hypothetical protein [Sphingomonas sp. URHD0057]
MDSYREHSGDFDPQSAPETSAAADVAAAIGTDERRMHVRAYNHWVALLDGRDFPSIEDLEPGDVADFSPHSVLLDFTCGVENPAMPYLGAAIRDECGLDDDMRTISEVPSRSLLSRLTDHYMQIIANRAPVGFEAEFQNQRDENICYRGILMPFSSDGDTIDFIYGVINWKKVGELGDEESAFDPTPAALNEEVLELGADEAVAPDEGPRWYGESSTDEVEAPTDLQAETPIAPPHFSWEDGPLAEADGDAEADAAEVPEVMLDDDAGLADRLWAARETAESVKAGEGRTRSALYRALALAYDFAIAAAENPADYAELLEESGVKAQARAPMTPIVKLIFGIDYDKARLTEFAAALSFAHREDVAAGTFQDFIEKQHGGLKALVVAERQARRPEAKPDTRGEIARARLRHAATISLANLPSADEFAVIVTRRGADGSHEPVAILDDEALIERAIRKAA